MENNIKKEEATNRQKIEEVKESSKKYEELSAEIKEIKSKEELEGIIDKLKQNGLYDDCHPFFVENSPFYLSTTEEDHLEVIQGEPLSEEGMSFLEIN